MEEVFWIDPLSTRALSHPIRVEILEVLQNRVASSAELSEQIGARQGVVSYHAKLLVHCGCLQLVHSALREGAVENYFSVTGS